MKIIFDDKTIEILNIHSFICSNDNLFKEPPDSRDFPDGQLSYL